ncbi:hypothetical protein ACQP2E_00155 [Actinoplanes sp. CA-015351]|uniref:hypothetical protein n=1 Tax=Actinoplanes sp. CA-015351 TaxID=3239897 RepID=UPI003D969F51
MTGWKVERFTRTASRSSSVPDGGSPLMPYPNQGAERRQERRAGHTGSRWAVRALVIGGLAGAAWLLTATAANAADHDAEPAGSAYESTSNSVAQVYGDELMVGELLEAAVQPLESEPAPKLHRRVVTSILTTAERMLSGPVEMPYEVTYDGTAIDADPFGAEPRWKIAPSRTSGGRADDRTRPEPDQDAAVTVNELDMPDAEAEKPQVDVESPLDGGGAAPIAKMPQAAGDAAAANKIDPSTSESSSIKASRAPAGVTPARHAKAEPRSHVHRRVPAARSALTVAYRQQEAPVEDGPSPARMNLGTVSGIPAGGPGASPEVGPVAVLPARVVNGAVDSHRFPFAVDVEARRNDAVAPTVSPD